MTWHVAVTKSGKEPAAVHDMMAIGIEAYYPQKVRWKQLQLRKVPVSSPIIPGYVFFRLNEPDEQRYIDTCDGVTGVLTMGFTPQGDRKLACIGGGWVESIREQEQRGDFDSTIDRSTKAKPGDRIRIVTGAFADRMAVILRAANKREWKVEVETTGPLKPRTTVSKAEVESLEEAA
jgi:transcription antitermination factor NusG